MTKPLVSIFIPVYNGEKYIRESLDSVLNQTYKNIEILIIDDGSTDNTVSLIESYDDKRIRLIKNSENKGLPYTRNLGLKEATGKYLAIMDADDISTLDRIEKQMEIMEQNVDIDVVISYAKIFGSKANKVWKPPITNEEIAISLLFMNQICNSSSMMNLDKIKNYNIKYNEAYFAAQDYEFWSQVSKILKFYVIPEVLVYYRFGHENITKKTLELEEKAVKRNRLVSLIHNDLIDFYDFRLSDYEKAIYNKIFNDKSMEILNNNEILKLQEVLKNIIILNNEKKIFDSTKLTKIMGICTIKHISKQNTSLKYKYKLYNKLVIDNNNILIKIEFIKLVIKHILLKI